MLKKLKIILLTLLTFLNIIEGQTEVWLNIFVHGIIKTPFSLNDFSKISSNQVEGTQHHYMVDYIRERPEIYSNQPMQKKGLIQIDTKDNSSSLGAVAIAKLYNYQANSLTSHRLKQRHHNKTYNLYYTYGWSGYLSRLHRQRDAKKFYKALKEQVDNLKQNNIVPRLRIIAFSHGGNLVLNMARYLKKSQQGMPLKIDETIFMAMPIHKDSDIYINHPIFDKIYSFYSTGDIAQKADLFSTKYVSSSRKFGRKDLIVPDKVKQIQLRVTNVVLDRCTRAQRKYHIDPNHIEFWNFGWCTNKYRDKFPLRPFSVISLIPFLKDAIDSIPELSNDLVLDIVPNLYKLIITDNDTKLCFPKNYTLPFISKHDLSEMRKICFKYKKVCESQKCCRDNLIRNAMSYALCKRSCKKDCELLRIPCA